MCQVRVGNEPSIKGESVVDWSWNGKWKGTGSKITACVTLSWYSRVYKRGIAKVDGCFVLDVIEDGEDRMVVLAGRQSRGFSVVPRKAVIARGDNGVWRIVKWLKHETD